ncbi:MAG: hypothetical protein LBM77_03035 [Spirochaetaceae bacterium]|jgi:hypothetical protein|nr:hypothetical protein [Spirochaetaceae bacterium]
MKRAMISISGISEKEFLDLFELKEKPNIGTEITVMPDVKIINGTSFGMGIAETEVFQIVYPIISGIAINLFSAWLYDKLKEKKLLHKTKLRINGEHSNIEVADIQEHLENTEDEQSV